MRPSVARYVHCDRAARDRNDDGSTRRSHAIGLRWRWRLRRAQRRAVLPDPSLLASISATGRVRLGPVRFGPTGSYRISDTSGHSSTSFGAHVALGLASPHTRLDLEVALELGGQRISSFAARAFVQGTSRLAFWSPLGATDLGASLTLSDKIALRAALRMDGAPVRDVARDVTYCDRNGCQAPVPETWQVGGFTFGGTVGFRFVFH